MALDVPGYEDEKLSLVWGVWEQRRGAARRMSKKRPISSQFRLPADLPPNPNESFNPGKSTVLGLLWDSTDRITPVESESESGVVRLSRIIEPDPDQAPTTFVDGTETVGYEFLKHVGEGGFGEVWEVVQRSLGRRIAIKRLRKELLQDVNAKSYVARHLVSSFRQEALTTGALEHPNIVPVYDLGVDDEGNPLMAMKMVRGRKWDDVIEQDFHLPAGEFLARHLPILIDVAQAVAFAHSRGVVHRDVKPTQVMLGEFGEVLLMDWGLALVFDPGKAELQGPQLALSEFTPWSPRVTNPAGTPSYMAPEQTEEAAVEIGSWTDVYLLGGCLYYLLTGYAPHEEETSEASFRKAVEGVVVPPSKRAPDRLVPEDLEALCMRALAADRQDRPTALEFIDALSDYLTGAGRKREAAALFEAASRQAKEVWAEFADYDEMGDVANMLERALLLDPDNKKASELRQQVLLNFARTAIGNSDLRLARFHAERLRAGEERNKILREIALLQDQHKRAQKSLEHLYARAAEERNAAVQARGEAEALIASIMQRMIESFGTPDHAPLIKPMAREILKLLERNTERHPTRDSLKSRITCYRTAAEALQAVGALDEALQAYRLAEIHLKTYLKQEPTDEAFGANLTQVRERIRLVNRATSETVNAQRVVNDFESARKNLMKRIDEMIEG
ncbi:MAG: eukaryotic-like serine/threonine-protein kinase [Candidatus Sumerlaeota bacterium]|nr:eukaryotic-like serine/threonine-protein kinase [Candidatus Sumerlaeota bacterium]